MLKILNQPFPYEQDFRKKIKTILFSSLFVFLFLFLFKPFGLAEIPSNIFFVECCKYGLLTLMVLAVVNLCLPPIFPTYFTEAKWTVLKDISFGIFNILLIGLANFFYVTYKYSNGINLTNAAYFVAITFLVGVFPVTFLILRKQIVLNKKSKSEALELSNQLMSSLRASAIELKKINSSNDLITLVADNGKDNYSFSASEILFIAAAGNYIEVFENDHNKTNKTLIRCSLKLIEKQLASHSAFIRCHRTFIVNTKNVSSVSGNSQGIRLHFKNYIDSIPVSRNLDAEIFQRLAQIKK